MLVVSYDWVLVGASVVVAILASFTGLRLASGLRVLAPAARKPQIAKAAIALGGGIWSMHFIGMLAVRLPVAIEYDALATLGSALVAILITGIGLGLLHFGERTERRIVYAGIAMGLGIVLMHYIGMSAIRGNCVVSYSTAGIFLASAVGILASIGALWLAYKKRSLRDIALGAVVQGLSISAMHYTGMIYTRFSPSAELVVLPEPILSSGVMALLVAVAAFLICGFFLLTAIPGDAAETTEDAEAADLEASDGEALEPLRKLPYESNNATHFLPVDDIRAIRAEGHYTRLFDGSGEYFCPLSISVIESRLDNPNFLKTHRSHLVNMAHVSGIQKVGDKAACLLDDEASSQIPVSRARVRDVRRALGFAG
ncbi:MAG: MHYT domain-containing protein [Pseudomonadota bacterium]